VTFSRSCFRKCAGTPGFAIAGWNKPADETGGDFYDREYISDSRLMVALGDVTGHGIGPALLAATCRAYARSSFAVHADLFAVTAEINAGISRDWVLGRHLGSSRWLLQHWRTGNLIGGARTNQLPYSATADSFHLIDSQGLPLGILPDFISEPPAKVRFEKRDTFLLITDGFVEFENPVQEQFGTLQLEQSVRSCRHLLPDRIIESIYGAVQAFSKGSKQQDDLTAVLIKRT
jgi:serine phosphatase RsbU (regulator of sigma subunit)